MSVVQKVEKIFPTGFHDCKVGYQKLGETSQPKIKQCRNSGRPWRQEGSRTTSEVNCSAGIIYYLHKSNKFSNRVDVILITDIFLLGNVTLTMTMISKMKNRMRKLLALLIYAYTDVFWSRQATTFFASFYACYGDAHSARSRYSNNNGCSTNNDDDYHNRELVVEKEAAEQTLVGPARLFKIRDWHQGTWELPLVHDDFIKKNKWTHKQNCCCAICT